MDSIRTLDAVAANRLHVKICARGCDPHQERADRAVDTNRGNEMKADTDSEGDTMWVCERERVRGVEASPMRAFKMEIVELLGLR